MFGFGQREREVFDRKRFIVSQNILEVPWSENVGSKRIIRDEIDAAYGEIDKDLSVLFCDIVWRDAEELLHIFKRGKRIGASFMLDGCGGGGGQYALDDLFKLLGEIQRSGDGFYRFLEQRIRDGYIGYHGILKKKRIGDVLCFDGFCNDEDVIGTGADLHIQRCFQAADVCTHGIQVFDRRDVLIQRKIFGDARIELADAYILAQ